jgi:hypothetical protein
MTFYISNFIMTSAIIIHFESVLLSILATLMLIGTVLDGILAYKTSLSHLRLSNSAILRISVVCRLRYIILI